jgi:hypothetical protein
MTWNTEAWTTERENNYMYWDSTINVREYWRGNQKWTIQRHWQHEGAIRSRQSRDTGNTKGQSEVDNPETLATRRGNQKWTIHRDWQHRVHKTKTINVREYWRGNQKWTIQRHWQHRVHKTKKNKPTLQHNMCWTPLCTNKQLEEKKNRTSFPCGNRNGQHNTKRRK